MARPRSPPRHASASAGVGHARSPAPRRCRGDRPRWRASITGPAPVPRSSRNWWLPRQIRRGWCSLQQPNDLDAQSDGAGFWHWVITDRPATAGGLPRGASAADGTKLPVPPQPTAQLAGFMVNANAIANAEFTATCGRWPQSWVPGWAGAPCTSLCRAPCEGAGRRSPVRQAPCRKTTRRRVKSPRNTGLRCHCCSNGQPPPRVLYSVT